MADRALKVTLLFDDHGTGWSETVYFNSSDNTGRLKVGNDTVEHRASILGSGVTIIGFRIGNTITPRDVLKREIGVAGAAVISDGKAGTGVAADSPYTCALIPFKTAKGTRRYVTVSGVPDAWIERSDKNGTFYLNQAGKDGMLAYSKYLALVTPQLMIHERKTGGEFDPVKVTAIVAHTNGQYRITYAGGNNLTVGSKVVVSKAKGVNLGRTRGTRKVVQVIDANNVVIDTGGTLDQPTPSLTGTAFITKVDYEYNVASATEDTILISSRKRGRPSSPRRGRRTASR